jgi:LuxR family quorum-sensing system transcriptional regulator CciR
MSSPLERVQDFAATATAISTVTDLRLLMAETAQAFGADYFLMIHHADFSDGGRGLVRVGNYPEEFIRISRQNGRPLDDPIMEACRKTLTGFFWTDVGAYVELTERFQQRVEAVERTGLSDGFVVPTNVPGEPLGSCHFATQSGRRLPRENATVLQTVATYGFEAARRLAQAAAGPARPLATLSDRQRECIILSAKGKSDTVIGQLLGLSPKTVNAYLEAAKKRYGVATRSQLIVRALYASDISFVELVEPERGETAFAAAH